MYAAAASVAGAAFLYIFCDPTEPRRRCGVGRRRGRTVHVHGLVNRGNQCFVNSVVQAFASCPALMHRLAECIQQRRVLFDLCARTRAWLLEGVSSDHESLPITSSRSIWSFLLFGRKRIQRPLKLDFSGLNQCNLSLSAIAADQARLTKAMHHILTALNGQDNGGRLILSAALIIDALKTPTFCCNNEEQVGF